MDQFNTSDAEYYSIVKIIFTHELRKRRLLALWKALNEYLLRHIGDSEKENHIEQIEEDLRKIEKEEAAWSHLKNCIYLQVFPYIPQVDYQK